ATTYNVPFAVRLRGAVDTRALRAAIGDLITRHEVLRTVYTETDGEPRQTVLAPEDTETPFTIRHVPAGDLAETVESEAGHVFDLGRDLPVRFTLLSTTEDEHVLVVLMHHIATDEWSTGPLLTDLDTAYTARQTNTPPDYPELPLQYADFALWQHTLLGNPTDPASLAAR
ncbi:condensation domain-containing protein, partial [Streptomyces sp. C10-9-1]|uniref:condensation domain-containing protein n=1 Tax=Streptomyces sp. C10-9-1 TaxID=1859285 RepID=UPI003D73761C